MRSCTLKTPIDSLVTSGFRFSPRQLTPSWFPNVSLFRRVTALLSASLVLQSLLLGSGAVCQSRAMRMSAGNDASHGGEARAVSAAGHQSVVHASSPARGPQTGAVIAIAAADDVDACPGMSDYGCGLPGVPSRGDCRTMSSCASTAATIAPSVAGPIVVAAIADPQHPAGAPASWVHSPESPPPRA